MVDRWANPLLEQLIDTKASNPIKDFISFGSS
jgi:hypothetical protein